MLLPKPFRVTQLNKSHPLARGLVGCWLMNESTGGKVFDLSGNCNTGTLQDNTSWTAGKFGSCLKFDDSGDYVDYAANKTLDFRTTPFTLIAWVNYNTGSPTTRTMYEGLYTKPYWLIEPATNRVRLSLRKADDSGVEHYYGTSGALAANIWWNLVVTYDRQYVKHYVNGIFDVALARTGNMGGGVPTSYRIGGRPPDAFNGIIGSVIVFNRALTAKQVAWLYREPFCMFERMIRPELIGSQIINVAGTSVALSSLSATAKAIREIGGTIASTSDVRAPLNSIRGVAGNIGGLATVDGSLSRTEESLLEIERSWLRGALFNGMTANAFKLGTTLSLGWFWVRVAGCSGLYRGPSMKRVDFVNILTVAEQDACTISPPIYLLHNSSSTYFYVIRRFNNCGYQEHTLAAAVKVSVESNGDLAKLQPNKVFCSSAERADGSKIQLFWFYCPLEQKSHPVCFNVYYDGGVGQIDYENPIATIRYEGRKFYSYQSGVLDAGKYSFAIRAEDVGGIENRSLARLRSQLSTANPSAIEILSADAV